MLSRLLLAAQEELWSASSQTDCPLWRRLHPLGTSDRCGRTYPVGLCRPTWSMIHDNHIGILCWRRWCLINRCTNDCSTICCQFHVSELIHNKSQSQNALNYLMLLPFSWKNHCVIYTGACCRKWGTSIQWRDARHAILG